MGDVSYSIGVAKVMLEGVSLRAMTGAGVTVDASTSPLHESKLGQAKLAGTRHVATSIRGTLDFTAEELPVLAAYFAAARNMLLGIPTPPMQFACEMAVSPATISGLVIPAPQFTITTSQDGWSACQARLELCGPPSFAGASVVANGAIAAPVDRGADTANARNLNLHSVRVSGVSGNVIESTLSVSCGVSPVLRGFPRWTTDLVIDTVDVRFECGVENFSGAEYRHDPTRPLTVTYTSLGGVETSFDLGSNCCVTAGSVPRTGASQWNTWRLTAVGNRF